MSGIWIGPVRYDAEARGYLDRGDHYLHNSPPGALFAIGVRRSGIALIEGCDVGEGPLLGLCVVGRPVAPRLSQTGSVGEITRMHLAAGLPHGTASRVLVRAAEVARARGMSELIAYHDRTRHTGCIYRKAGFRRDGVVIPKRDGASGWGSRPGRNASAIEASFTPKRRWSLVLTEAA